MDCPAFRVSCNKKQVGEGSQGNGKEYNFVPTLPSPPVESWQCLETFLIVTIEGERYATSI
jgi:hypothetical protein